MLECVINISEGRDVSVLHTLAMQCRDALLDAHIDPDHNRTVFTLAGPQLDDAIKSLITAVVQHLDLNRHQGVHPRIGLVDVVPFVPLEGSTPTEAKAARDLLAAWVVETLGIPIFLYGDERSLPKVRKQAFGALVPDLGPAQPHPTAGAIAMGYRDPLVAYNLWLTTQDKDKADLIAREMRSDRVRALALRVGNTKQVSLNLLDPEHFGPKEAYDHVRQFARIDRAELVGLMPESSLGRIAPEYWEELDLDADRTIENRLFHLLSRQLPGDSTTQ